MWRLAQWPGETGGLRLECTDGKLEHNSSKRKHGLFLQWQRSEDAKGTASDTLAVEQMVSVRRHEREKSLPPTGGGRLRWLSEPACENLWRSRHFLCGWNSRHPPALHIVLQTVVCVARTCLSWVVVAIERFKVLFSIWPPGVCSVAFRYLFLCPSSSKCPPSCRLIAKHRNHSFSWRISFGFLFKEAGRLTIFLFVCFRCTSRKKCLMWNSYLKSSISEQSMKELLVQLCFKNDFPPFESRCS